MVFLMENELYGVNIPEDWDVKELKSFVKTQKGKKPAIVFDECIDGAVPYLTTDYFRTGIPSKYALKTDAKNPILVNDNDIVLLWDGSKAGDVFTGLSGILSSTCVKLNILDNNIDKKYFYYFLKTKFELFNRHTTGSTIPHVNKTLLNNLGVPIPPLDEQKKISYVLSTIQETIEKSENLINALKELKNSTMKHLFTYGAVKINDIENVKLKETEIGLIPEDWEVVKLEDIVDVKGGKRLPKGHAFSDNPTKYPYIRVSDFVNWSVDLNNLKYLTFEDAQKLKRYIITSEDVYISIAGTIGMVGLIPKELDGANLTENAARLIIKNKTKLDKLYLVAFLASEIGQREIDLRTTKTSQPKLALSRIKQIPVSLPPLNEQKKIAEILSTIDQKIEKEENRKKALNELFNSMLNNLMTGKIRVNNLNFK
jgi:type I restriction enzyme S subunit